MKNKIILLIVAVLLILGLLYWFIMRPNTSPTASLSDKLIDKVAYSASFKCDVNNNDSSTSTVYVKNKMIRTQSENNGIKSNLIIKNNQFWVWENSKTEGMTWVLPTGVEGNSQMPSLGGIASIGFNYQALLSGAKEMMNKCTPTSIDDKLFDVPNNVTFKDMSSMADGIKNMMEQSPSNTNGNSAPNNEQIQKMIQENLQN